VLGFDGSYNVDSTALLGCTVETTPHIFVVKLWERPASARKWVVPRAEVDTAVRQALERWKVLELACDPPGWHAEIDQWAEDYGSPPVVEVRTQETRVMAELCSRFYTCVVARGLAHDGNPRLAAHLANAVVRERPEGATITKVDRHSSKKIDAAVAAVLAFGRAAMAEPPGGVIYMSADPPSHVLYFT
jgi:phage terminase large subunit-like protein